MSFRTTFLVRMKAELVSEIWWGMLSRIQGTLCTPTLRTSVKRLSGSLFSRISGSSSEMMTRGPMGREWSKTKTNRKCRSKLNKIDWTFYRKCWEETINNSNKCVRKRVLRILVSRDASCWLTLALIWTIFLRNGSPTSCRKVNSTSTKCCASTKTVFQTSCW